MGAHFLESDLDGPAPHEPLHDLRGLAGRIRSEQGLRREACLGIADDHPADRYDGQAAVPPHCGVGGDLDDALARPVTARHHDRVPECVLGCEGLGERGHACALGARASDRAGWPRRSGIVECCVEPQAGDRRDAGAAHRVEEQQGRKAAVAHHHEIAPR